MNEDKIINLSREQVKEGVTSRLRSNIAGITDFAKGVTDITSKDSWKDAAKSGHDSRYSKLASIYMGDIVKKTAKFAEYLLSVQQTMVDNGMADTYNQYCDKIQNIVNTLTNNAKLLELNPSDLPQVPQKVEATQPQQEQPTEQQVSEAEEFDIYFKQISRLINEAQEKPAPSPTQVNAPVAAQAKAAAPQAQPAATNKPVQQKPGGEENMNSAKEVVTDFYDALLANDDETGPGRQMILGVLQQLAKGVTPEQALKAYGMDPASVNANKAKAEKAGIDMKEVEKEVRQAIQESINESINEGFLGFGKKEKSPTDEITAKLQKFEQSIAATIGEFSADLKDMGFNKKSDKEMKDAIKELDKQKKNGDIDDEQYKQEIEKLQAGQEEQKFDTGKVDGVINQLRKDVLSNVDVSLRGKDGLSGHQSGFAKFLHWGGRTAMATLIGMAVNAVMPGFSALGMAGPYVNKALVGGALSVIRDASTGQLDKKSLKRALIGASIGCLAQFGKEVMSAPEIVRTNTRSVGDITDIADRTQGVNDVTNSTSLFSNNASVVSGQQEVLFGDDKLAAAVGAQSDKFSTNTFGNIQSFSGKAGNLGTWVRSLFDQRVADQIGDNAVAVDIETQIENNLGTIMSNVQAGKMNAQAAKEALDRGKESLAETLNSKYHDNLPPEAKNAILRQYDYASKQVMGRVNGILTRIGNHIKDFLGTKQVAGGGDFHSGVANTDIFNANRFAGMTDDQIENGEFEIHGSQALSRLQNIGKKSVSENTKVTLTIAQIRQLIRECRS